MALNHACRTLKTANVSLIVQLHVKLIGLHIECTHNDRLSTAVRTVMLMQNDLKQNSIGTTVHCSKPLCSCIVHVLDMYTYVFSDHYVFCGVAICFVSIIGLLFLSLLLELKTEPLRIWRM